MTSRDIINKEVNQIYCRLETWQMLELGIGLRLMVRVGVKVKGYVYDFSVSHI